ncbi:methylase involved in ubiquinone/menaquinone biosynthesis [Beggiatoa alba B18LD]|uniref:Malonyl-[acyl-carrier protein] O-methyltransferase n=1 Tax=Beggiatoa alba B18LD TaxID=395493 RepID=I3CL22_9GAMM|nr:malonyl-ACP O-methyltransferase BioC [Beggiatoa alba]EIJ44315.1 methylase involved in ubiquinone/menaquinone biosynthesis [Beggiatoa alba B18LD]
MDLTNALYHRLIAHSFGRAAHTYEQFAHLQKQVSDQLLERSLELKIQPTVIADIGAGSGHLTRSLSRHYPQAQVYAIDIALPMLQVARQQVPWSFPLIRPRRQHFITANATQLPLASNSIDLLVSSLMLQWCPDFADVFAEFARVLKPDGVLLFSTLGLDTLKELRQSWATVDDTNHVNQFIDMHILGDALLRAGLHNPVMDIDWHRYFYADVFTLMRELKAIGAQTVLTGKRQGLTGKNKFNAMLAQYEQFRTPQGLTATYEVVYGHASGCKTPKSQPSHGEVRIPISQIQRIKTTK